MSLLISSSVTEPDPDYSEQELSVNDYDTIIGKSILFSLPLSKSLFQDLHIEIFFNRAKTCHCLLNEDLSLVAL